MELRCKVTLVVAPREQARASGLSYPGNCRCLTLFHVLVCPGPGLASENNLFLCPNLPSSRLHLLLILANPCSLAWSSLAADVQTGMVLSWVTRGQDKWREYSQYCIQQTAELRRGEERKHAKLFVLNYIFKEYLINII